MTPTCPRCNQVVANADVNVANDIAFCRTCNVAHKLSDLVHGLALSDVDLAHPPQGAWHSQMGMGTVIGATHRSIGMAIGALAISLFWNGITSVFVSLALSSTLKHIGVGTPDWFPDPKMNGGPMSVGMTIFLWLFLTPFILIGLAMIGAFLSSLGGRTEIRIGPTEGVIFNGIGSFGRRKRFNTETVRDVRIQNEEWRGRHGRRNQKKSILIETQDGKQHKFGSMLREDRMNFVASALRQTLLSPQGAPSNQPTF